MYEDYVLSIQSQIKTIQTNAISITRNAESNLVTAQKQQALVAKSSMYSPNNPTVLTASATKVPVGTYVNGGRNASDLTKLNTFKLPGYERANMVIVTPSRSIQIDFLMGLSGVSTSRSNVSIPNKTIGGWFIYRLGNNLMNLTAAGSLLDTKDAPEKLQFLDNYKKYIEDQRDAQGRFYNDNYVTLYAQGIKYVGLISSLQITEAAERMFAAALSFQMMVIKDTNVFNANKAVSYPADNIVAVIPQKPVSNDVQILLTTTAVNATE